MKTLSIIIPAYNEERWIGPLLEKILSINTEALGFKKEIFVVDDCSKDNTVQIASRFPGVQVVKQPKNKGKGATVRAGVKLSTGDYVLVQDADLEYNPEDYIVMLQALLQSKTDTAIYGSRLLGQKLKSRSFFFRSKHPKQNIANWGANLFLTVYTWLLYRVWITDTLTAYKLYPGNLVRNYDVQTCGFETDHELTALLVKHNIPISEVPIDYNPRSKAEGKKIKLKDFFIALKTLWAFRNGTQLNYKRS